MGNMPTCDIAIIIVCAGRHGTTERRAGAPGMNTKYDLLSPAERNLHSYEEAISQMKDFLHKRIQWLDENIETIRQYSAESRIKKFNENAN